MAVIQGITVLLFISYVAICWATFTNKCMHCICEVESGCKEVGCKPDMGSLSCGPYQIKEPYWIDCGRPGADWKSCSNNMGCAEKCVKAYLNRYGTSCTKGRTPVCEDYARIHNGGPKGCQKNATLGYWGKVKRCCGSQTGCDQGGMDLDSNTYQEMKFNMF